jgi:hypothetical protein
MILRRSIAISALIALPLGIVAAAQQFPAAPAIPQVTPPAAGGESLAVTELRIALQKAQIQSALADRIAQVKDANLKSLQEKEGAGAVEVGAQLNAQCDAISARAAAESARLDVLSLDIQSRAGAAAVQQAQAAFAQQQGVVAPNSLIAQLMQNDFKKIQLQANAAAQMTPIRQKIYDQVSAQYKAGVATAEKLSDALLDLEAAKAAQQTAALDQQLMTARMTSAGLKP